MDQFLIISEHGDFPDNVQILLTQIQENTQEGIECLK